MVKQFAARPRLLAVFATIAFVCSASASRADISDLLRNFRAGPGTSTRQVLPAISNPRPYRQTVAADCNTTTAVGANSCNMGFAFVPSAQVLQIDHIDCLGGTFGGAIIFNTNVVLDAAHFAGVAVQPGSTGIGVANGPYYFLTGERPRLVSTSNSATDSVLCSIYGTLWDSN